jgi:hypothetical protein
VLGLVAVVAGVGLVQVMAAAVLVWLVQAAIISFPAHLQTPMAILSVVIGQMPILTRFWFHATGRVLRRTQVF